MLYDYCGLSRSKEGLTYVIDEIRKLRDDFYKNVKVPGDVAHMDEEQPG